jgi:hypothetical protein
VEVASSFELQLNNIASCSDDIYLSNVGLFAGISLSRTFRVAKRADVFALNDLPFHDSAELLIHKQHVGLEE